MPELQTDKHQSTTLQKNGLKQRLFLKPFDVGILVFSTLIINLFSLVVPLVTLQVYDRILAFQSAGTLQVLCAGVVVVVVLDIFLKLSRSSLIGWTSARFEHTAYSSALAHLMNAKLKSVKAFTPSEHLHKLGAIAKLKSFYSGQSMISLIDMPFVAIFLGFIWYLSGWLVLVPVILLGIFIMYAGVLAANIKKALEMRDHHDDKRINLVSEILENIHTVKMLGLETALVRRHEFLQGQNVHDSHDLSARNAQGYNAAALFTQIMMVAMISIGALMVLQGSITMGVLIACVLLSGRVMQPVQKALSFWISFQEYRLARHKIDALFDLPTQEKLSKNVLKTPKGKLEIKNLCFEHDTHKKDAPDSENTRPLLFDNMNLTLKPGEVIALGGPPGDGKTSLLKLIAGLYEPGSGIVSIDGVETCRIPCGDIPKYVGYLPADADIFQGTILENITSFRPDLNEAALEMASHLGIDKVVSKLSQGYQTLLFDGPADPLTPGMKQRITICRVLVNRPRILLFDFADKSLDKEGYNHVFRLLGQLKGQASMILVSNDRNILHLAREEYLIEDGKLIAKDDSRYSKSEEVLQPLQELRV